MSTTLDRIDSAMNSLESLLDNYRHDGVDVDDIATQAAEIISGMSPLLPLLRAWERALWDWDEATANPYANRGVAQSAAMRRAELALVAALRGENDEPECSHCTLTPGLMGAPSHHPECPEVASTPRDAKEGV